MPKDTRDWRMPPIRPKSACARPRSQLSGLFGDRTLRESHGQPTPGASTTNRARVQSANSSYGYVLLVPNTASCRGRDRRDSGRFRRAATPDRQCRICVDGRRPIVSRPMLAPVCARHGRSSSGSGRAAPSRHRRGRGLQRSGGNNLHNPSAAGRPSAPHFIESGIVSLDSGN